MAYRGRKLQSVAQNDLAPTATGASVPAAALPMPKPPPVPKPPPARTEDVIKFAPGQAGQMARRAVSKAKHPMIIVQDPEGRHKPLHHEFAPANGRSTVPICMIGHPDDVPGGPLFSTEAAIVELQKR